LLSGRRKLLLADDSPTVQKVISLTFGDEGFEVVTVGDGAKALAALEADPPDVLLADVHMPGPNGLELCERVRQSERLRHIPVVLLVGTFEPFNEAEARRVGADTVLTKPFQSIRDLVSKVGSLLGGESKHEEAAAEAHAGQPTVEPPAGQTDAAHQQAAAHAETFGAHEFEPQAEHDVAFADFSSDDELIETKSADAFGFAPAQAETSPRDQFVSESHAEDASHSREADETRAYEADETRAYQTSESHGAETREHDAFAQPQSDLGEPFAANVQSNMEQETHPTSAGAGFEAAPSSSFAAAHEVGERVLAARAAFNGRSAVAASTDDALLDLGQTAPPAPAASSETDDFILDLDDDFALDAPDAPAAFAEAAHGEHASQPVETASVYEEPAPVEDDASPLVPTEVVMQDEPQQFSQHGEPQAFAPHDEAHAPLGFVEPEVVPADAPVPASVESEYTDGSVEGDVSRPPASLYHTNPMFEAATGEQAHEASAAHPAAQENAAASEPLNAGQVGESRAGVNEQLRADQLSPEAVEQIARRVVELMSDKVVREVTWEVVPELAELLIKQWLDEGRQK
jgi:CheY-like chemotaxis protein